MSGAPELEELDLIRLIQTVLAALSIGGIGWVIRRVSSTQLEIATSSHEIRKEMAEGFHTVNGRMARIEQWTIDHEKLDVEQQKRLDERYGDLREALRTRL